jgi:FAD/FMN-containing dehydrogenase
VVRPLHRDDCIQADAVRYAPADPAHSPGAGTSLAGQCVGPGLVVDLTRHMDQSLGIDLKQRRARVQPGVVPADLSERLCKHGLMFAPDPSSNSQR